VRPDISHLDEYIELESRVTGAHSAEAGLGDIFEPRSRCTPVLTSFDGTVGAPHRAGPTMLADTRWGFTEAPHAGACVGSGQRMTPHAAGIGASRTPRRELVGERCKTPPSRIHGREFAMCVRELRKRESSDLLSPSMTRRIKTSTSCLAQCRVRY
jgi:hypothetical protein